MFFTPRDWLENMVECIDFLKLGFSLQTNEFYITRAKVFLLFCLESCENISVFSGTFFAGTWHHFQ